MKKSYLKKFVAVFALVAMLASASSVFAATNDSFITPWTTTCDFNDATFKHLSTDAENWGISDSNHTYLKLGARAGVLLEARDSSSVDENNNPIPDGVTGELGDKYAYFDVCDTTEDPGAVYFHQLSSSLQNNNGGLTHGKIAYEFYIRVDNITKKTNNTKSSADYAPSGSVSLFGWDSTNSTQVEVIKIPINTNYDADAGTSSFYFSGAANANVGNLESGFAALKCGEWAQFIIEVDTVSGTVVCSQIGIQNTAQYTNTWTKEYNPVKSVSLMTSYIKIVPPSYCTTSIDNISVTKETFLIDEANTVIDKESSESEVLATVKVANDVYANKWTKPSGDADTVATVSPVAILAVYDKDNMLVDVDTKTYEFDSATYNCGGGATNFSKSPDYKDISLSCTKPSGDYTAKVYVWKSMSKMIPYTQPAE